MAQDNSGSDVIVSLPNGFGVRRFRQTDIANLARHANNPKVRLNLRNRMPSPYTEDDAKWWIDHVSNPENQVKSGAWTVENGSEGPKIPNGYAITVNDEAVGSIGLLFEDPNDVHARCAEIGYWLGEQHWGKGVMGSVVPAFVKWTWETFDILLRIEGDVYDRNVYSGKILEKAGFKYEGTKKLAYIKEGKVGDVILFAGTRPGYQA